MLETKTLAGLCAGLTLMMAATASAQPADPKIIQERGLALANACLSAGGKIGTPTTPLVTRNIDINADGKNDFVLKTGGFNCIGRPNMFASPRQGEVVEVFAGDGKGQAESVYVEAVHGLHIVGAKPAALYVALRGAACGAGAKATTNCEKQLLWNKTTKKLGPSGASTTSSVAAAAPPPAAKSSPFSGPAFTLTQADKTAALRAAGFRIEGKTWRSSLCSGISGDRDETKVVPEDINKDGRPEIWIQEINWTCNGNPGDGYWVMAKNSAGQWVQLIHETGEHEIGVHINGQQTNFGWKDIGFGQPGMHGGALYRFNGTRYVYVQGGGR